MRCSVKWGLVIATLGACGGATTNKLVDQSAPPGETQHQETDAPTVEARLHGDGAQFTDDVAFLKRYGEVLLLQASHGARVAVSAQYQGRVMTSAVAPDGASLGWIHRSLIESGKTGTPFDNYGGEDRFWLGPEAGQFGLFFPQGKPFEFQHWQTPRALQLGAWDIVRRSDNEVALRRTMQVRNYSGTSFEVQVNRTVSLMTVKDVGKCLGASLTDGVEWVAFQSLNRITNVGDHAWVPEKGLLSVWILAMFPPSPDTVVAVPFDTAGSGPVANDAYFGKVPKDRLEVDEALGVVLFQCDGNYRSKIGLTPARAKGVLGSYSARAQLLTVVTYDVPKGKQRYVNSMWEHQTEPYSGDVINSYNDGPPEPGKPPLGGFYELETSSPAAALAPGESLTHIHRTVHLVGGQDVLDPLARSSIGLSLARWSRGTHP